MKRSAKHTITDAVKLKEIPYDMHLFINNTCALSTKLNFNKTQLP